VDKGMAARDNAGGRGDKAVYILTEKAASCEI
jgi:hypothetical protein